MLDSVRFRKGSLWVVGVVLALVSCQQVDAAGAIGNNAAVPFNSGTGFDSPNQEGGQPPMRHFLRPSHATRAPSMAGRGGEPSGCRFLLAGLSTLPRACHPRLTAGSGFKPKKEATMPKSISRALSRLFPAIARPVATFPIEAEAVSFARTYLAQTGRAVTVVPATAGFEVIGGAA